MKRAVVIIIAIVVIGGGILVYAMTKGSDDSSSNADKTTATAPANDPAASSSTAGSSDTTALTVVMYNGKTFSPDNITVASGSKITIKNVSDNDTLDFDSDPHPVHTDDPDLNAGDIEPGQSKTITVTRKGSFGFHNHEDPSQHGNITIQ